MSTQKQPGTIYFVEEKDLLGFPTPNYVKIGLVKENEKGTSKMLRSIKKHKKNNSILIKFPKKKQDIRADLPTIGIETLKDCKKVGINGIVLKSQKNIFLDIRKSILYANKNNIFIKVV